MEKRIDASLVGKRLDETLTSSGFYPSRSVAKKMIVEGKVTINGKVEKPHYNLRENDLLVALEYSAPKADLAGEDIPLDIVYEDDDVLLINKPVGMVVHPGNGHYEGTLVNALIGREMALSEGDPDRPGIVHRIDKDTSGLLLVTKNDNAYRKIQEQLSTHTMHREYYALVKGVILEDDGKINAPIARDKNRPTRNCVDVLHGKEAITFFHVEKRYKESEVTLVSCRLLTGRTHQIRVHMDYIGHPVIGDPLYGTGNRKIYDAGQLLHAYKLTFIHPSSGKEMSFTAPLPEHFEKVLSSLK
ncbi:MAG: RluA family pseudouridine synthase [Bacilli bacterium]|nr:RluA family pseudouridine synthase [Bacilli bacterium]MEE3442909.1 RluA family pseudouridine synthase [Candidatus Enteromonas sp.]MEE3464377.1 RluA family pseudouridine synthase [Candidatus Enteromonas sp.]